MGGSPSRFEDLSKNFYLERLCGKEAIALDDEFWGKFLAYNMRPPLTRMDQIELDSRLDSSCQQLIANNPTTGNLGALIHVALMRINELLTKKDAENFVTAWQAYNALFAIRCVLKYFIETVGEDEMIRHVESGVSASLIDGMLPATLSSFFEALIEVVIDVPLSEYTYLVHLEAINCMLVLLSVQLFSSTPAEYSAIYRIAMTDDQSVNATILVCTLLKNFTEQMHAPPGVLSPQPGSSIVFSIAAGLWSVLTMRMGSSNSNKNSAQSTGGGNLEDLERKRDVETPLASQSLLLLLTLTNHCTASRNPFRDALFYFINVEDDLNAVDNQYTFRFNVDKLFKTICRISNADEVTLLLYMLLHRNTNFKHHVMKRLDIQLLVIPILRNLYHAPENTSHHIYMSLIILLILSEDETFNKRIHDITLKGVSWYTERSISEISLGGLLILVVIRTIQYNMLKMRDRYLHTNCLAALANMSSQFRLLHPYVSQRIVSLFETLAKKHVKLEATIKSQILTSTATNVAINLNGNKTSNDPSEDLAVLEEVLRMVLEIINSCLTNQLGHNPNLVYTLLYKRDIFQPFRQYPSFQDIIQNIDLVINFFSYRLEQIDQSQLGVSQVLQAIQEGTNQWPSDRLKKFPELKFKYVEEEQPEEFFIPYLWSVVCQSALLHWSAENIKLFSPNQSDQSAVIVC